MGSDPLNPYDPGDFGAEIRTGYAQEIPWPWYISRASGLLSYFLLFTLIVLGVGIKTRIIYKIINAASALAAHRFIGIILSITIAIHLISLLFDKYLKFTVIDILVPFVSWYRPLYVGFGVVAFYLFLAVIITSLFFRLKWPWLWRLLHYLTYPVFFLIFQHGIFSGTDAKTDLMVNSYWITGSIAAVLILFRLYHYWRKIRSAGKIINATV